MADALNHDLLNPHERKAHIKAKKKEYKQRTKKQKKGKTARSRVFVLDFDGDIRASAVEHLREEISAVVQVARVGVRDKPAFRIKEQISGAEHLAYLCR